MTSVVMVRTPPHWPRCRDGWASLPGSLCSTPGCTEKTPHDHGPSPPHAEPSPLHRNNGEEGKTEPLSSPGTRGSWIQAQGPGQSEVFHSRVGAMALVAVMGGGRSTAPRSLLYRPSTSLLEGCLLFQCEPGQCSPGDRWMGGSRGTCSLHQSLDGPAPAAVPGQLCCLLCLMEFSFLRYGELLKGFI